VGVVKPEQGQRHHNPHFLRYLHRYRLVSYHRYFNFIIKLNIELLYFAKGVLHFRCIWTYIFQ
jgi:hypothetical protein